MCPLYVRRGDSRIARSVSIITATNQKDQPPNFHVIARRAKPDVAIRISPAPLGPGGAMRRRGYGLPRRFAPRNDGGGRRLVLLICPGNERDMVGVGSAARPTGQMRIAPIS